MAKTEALQIDVLENSPKYVEAPRKGSVRCINSKSYHHISYQDWGDPDNPDVLFCIHGLTRNSHDFDVIAHQLSSRYRVICPDTVGRGDSDWLPDHEDYQIKQYNMDLTVLVAHIGCEEFDLLGTSLGGMMGMILAAMKGSPVRRLIVNDVGPEVPHTAMSRLGSYLHLDPFFNNLADVETHLRKTLQPFYPMTDEDWQHLALTSSKQDENGYRLAFDPDISNTYGRRYWYMMYFNLWKYWNRIKCPVLVLRGLESDFLTENLRDRMLSKLPHADLIEFEHAGHTPTLNDPSQIEPVAAWLKKTKPGGGKGKGTVVRI